MTIRFRCLYQPGFVLLPEPLAQPGQEPRSQVRSLRRWQAQQDKGSRWLNEQVFQLVSMQQHVVLSIAHQDHAVTAQIIVARYEDSIVSQLVVSLAGLVLMSLAAYAARWLKAGPPTRGLVA